jgi:hypothetical protein
MADEIAAENFRTLSAYLSSLGLGQLFSVDQQGNPGGWLWQQLIGGVDTAEELRAAVEQTDVWRDRFSVIVAQRERQARGEPVRVMEPGEVIEYEQRAAQLMRQYGLPDWFYDQASDFNDVILNGISVAELESRLAGAYNTVANLDPSIRETFEQFYGVSQADGALQAYFLDPNRTEAQLERVALAAYAGGVARDFGLELDRDQAELFSLYDRTPAGIVQDLTEINAQSLLAREGVGEADDLDTTTVFDAVVRGDAESRRLLEGRAIRRQANARAGGGGALATNDGLIGLGTAN